MKQKPNFERTLANRNFELCATASRLLLGLIALLTAASPWTQYYWRFDNFPRSTEDFEFNLLCAMLVFCLFLLLTKLGKQDVEFWFALRQWLAVLFQRPDTVASRFSFRLIPACRAVSPPDPILGVYELPLRI